MNNIRLLPVVILAISALLVLKTLGLVTHGGYVLGGVSVAEASGGGSGGSGGGEAPAKGGAEAAPGEAITLPSDPQIQDTSPTIADGAPTVGAPKAGEGASGEKPAAAEGTKEGDAKDAAGGHGAAPAEGEAAAAPAAADATGPAANSVARDNSCDPKPVGKEGGGGDTSQGQLTVVPGGCPPLTDARAQTLDNGVAQPLAGGSDTSQALLDRISTRRSELDAYQQELDMRASLVEAAEKRIDERQQTLKGIEDQISSLVEQRKQMEEGQFAAIVSMYETMKPKDAANIFNNLDMDVLLRVAKLMNPRKMSPILAVMDTGRAQELTVKMASASDEPADQMKPQDLAALPQIVGK